MWQMKKVSEIKANPANPRIIRDDKYKKLVNSLREFPQMLEKRPLVCVTDPEDGKIYPLGGNQRLRAAKDLKMKEIPVDMADDWTDEQRAEFTIKDNVGFGEWDFDMLASEWDEVKLEEWGLDLMGSINSNEDNTKNEVGDVEFSVELDQESNYIVLKFSKDIDFLQIEQILDLKTVSSKRRNGKPWSRGVGRVVDGVDAILKLKEWK